MLLFKLAVRDASGWSRGYCDDTRAQWSVGEVGQLTFSNVARVNARQARICLLLAASFCVTPATSREPLNTGIRRSPTRSERLHEGKDAWNGCSAIAG